MTYWKSVEQFLRQIKTPIEEPHKNAPLAPEWQSCQAEPTCQLARDCAEPRVPAGGSTPAHRAHRHTRKTPPCSGDPPYCARPRWGTCSGARPSPSSSPPWPHRPTRLSGRTCLKLPSYSLGRCGVTDDQLQRGEHETRSRCR